MAVTPMKRFLKKKYGTLRAAANKSGIDYYRVVNSSSGHIALHQEEIALLGVPVRIAKATFKVKHAAATA